MSCISFSIIVLVLCWILSLEKLSSESVVIDSEPSLGLSEKDKAASLLAWHEMIHPIIILPQTPTAEDHLKTEATDVTTSNNVISSSTTQHGITIVTALYEIGRAAYDGKMLTSSLTYDHIFLIS